MFDSDFIIPAFLLAGFTFLMGIFLGGLIGLRINDTDHQYKQTYCPQIYTETNQYLQCMNKPFEDTLKIILTKK